MADEVNGEAGLTEAPTPAPASAPASPGTNPASQASPAAEHGAPALDRDRQVFARLAEEARREEEDRPAPAAAAPSPQPTPAQQPAGAAEATPPPAPLASDVPAGYEGLDAAGYQLLRRTQLLPSAEEWKATPSLVRANLTRAANNVISEKSRAFNAQQQLAQRQATPVATPATPATPVPQNPPPGRQADAGGTDPALGNEAPGKTPTATPAKFDQLLENLRATYGDEVPDALTALRQQQDGEKQELLATVRTLQAQQAQAVFVPQEIAAAEQLIDEWPGFATHAADDAAADSIRASASVHYHAAMNARKPITWQQAVVRGAHSVFADEFQQNAQRQSAERRDATLRGTPERGNTRTASPKVLSGIDRDREVFARLQREAAGV